MLLRKVIFMFLVHWVGSSETQEETLTTSEPLSDDDYWLDLNDTFHYPDSYPIYDYAEEAFNSNDSAKNVTYDSLKKVLPIQLLLDPLYNFSPTENTENDSEEIQPKNGNKSSVLPVPLPLVSDKKSFYINANLNSGTSLFKVPGLPINFNDTQTQAFVAVSNTLLLLGSFFALQSLPARLLGRRRSRLSSRKEKRPPQVRSRVRKKKKKLRPVVHRTKKRRHRKVPKKHIRRPPPPPPPVYYDDEYYDDNLYDYTLNYDDEFPILSQKKLPPPPPPPTTKPRKIKNIENHKLLPPIIDLNNEQSPEELHENINKIKIHLDRRYTTKQTFADTFTRRPTESPPPSLEPVPQLTPERKVGKRRRIPIRRRPLAKIRRKHYNHHRRPVATRKTRPFTSRIDRRFYDDYEDENSGFYYEDSSPFTEDPYERFPELTQWYK